MGNYIAIFIGGGVGSIVRYALSRWIYVLSNSTFPVGTLVVNIISCFILGIFLGLVTDKYLINPVIKTFVVVGFCGGFSTFSTFSYETLELMRLGQYFYALANILLSVVVCIVCTWGGIIVAKLF